MYFYKALYFLILVTSASTVEDSQEPSHTNRRSDQRSYLRVIAGYEDTSNRYPYVVALGVPTKLRFKDKRILSKLYPEFYPRCTGSLVSEEWVLTASHCIEKKPGRASPTLIRYGLMAVPPNDTRATYSDILKLIMHPSYHDYGTILRNDVGLMLVKKVHLNVYGRISAVDYRTLVGLPVVYIGYGKSAANEAPLIRQTKSRLCGEAAVVPCSKLLLSKPVVCLSSKCSNMVQRSYYGDSGGPLLQAGSIVGVCTGVDPTHVFEELGMARSNRIYTATSPYLDWILTTMATTS